MKIINVVGARPNFVKMASIAREMTKHPQIRSLMVHTGQHYDERMSQLFFRELEIPKPDVDLEVGSGSHAVQTAEVMKRFEPIVIQEKPDYVLVVGDVNSTIACALTAVKLGCQVIHVEAGLRSFDRSMPEEINRILTDQISDWLFVSEPSGRSNLLREGIPEEKIFFVGNVMIDTLLYCKKKALASNILSQFGLAPENPPEDTAIGHTSYAVLTLHRPANVDRREILAPVLEALYEISQKLPILFPVHPRTRTRIEEFGLGHFFSGSLHTFEEVKQSPPCKRGIWTTEPLGYLDFLCLLSLAKMVYTDSGGIQEETTVLSVPCLTLRENTERPVTIEQGTNHLVGLNPERIRRESEQILSSDASRINIPELWDGHAAERIVRILLEHG